MRPQLQKAVRIYFQDEIDGIHPISTTDALIIDNLINLMHKSNPKLALILEQWKMKDDAVLERDIDFFVKEYKPSTPQQSDFGGKDIIKIMQWIHIGDDMLILNHISHAKKIDKYDEIQSIPLYCILLNETENARVYYANKVIEFKSSEMRDQIFESIKYQIGENDNHFFKDLTYYHA